MSFPSEFQMPMTDMNGRVLVDPSVQGMALKPIFGTVGNQYIKFFVKQEHNAVKSETNKYETLDDIEMVEVRSGSDKFMVLHKRVTELSREQREKWAAVYDAFKRQVQAHGTPIESWLAIADRQKALLMHCNIVTVEQLYNAGPDEIGRLGPEGKELHEAAVRHMAAKERKKDAAALEEIANLKAALEEQKKAAEAKEQAFFARLAALEAEKSKAPEKPFGVSQHDKPYVAPTTYQGGKKVKLGGDKPKRVLKPGDRRFKANKGPRPRPEPLDIPPAPDFVNDLLNPSGSK